MIRSITVLLLFTCVSVAHAQPLTDYTPKQPAPAAVKQTREPPLFRVTDDSPRLVIPEVVRPTGQYCTFLPDTNCVSVMYIGLSGVDPFPSDELRDGRKFVLHVYGLPEGSYKFAAIGATASGKEVRTDFDVVIGPIPDPKPKPKPPDPLPPDPKPKPDPVNPAPIPVAGLRVLIVWESAEPSKLTPGQSAAIHGKTMRDYLDAACVKVNGNPERRIFDKDVDAIRDSKLWADAMARPRTTLPWLLISNGVTGFEGPLPRDVNDTLNLIKKYEK